jgi:hypothetical protein
MMTSVVPAPVRCLCRAATVALLTLAALGCGGRRGDVSGKVTYQGKPLVFGTVQFEAGDGTFKQANIDKDGNYAIQGLPVGEAKAAVNSPDPNSGDFQPLRREGDPPPPPRPKFTGWFRIPADYQNLAKPQLSYTIKSGQNSIDIELK